MDNHEDTVNPALEPSNRSYNYIIGIDLGTTNSAVAYLELAPGEEVPETPGIRPLEIPQLVTPGQVSARPLFSSFLYLPGPHDLPAGSTGLPWDPDRSYAVGEFAREQGSRVPGRMVSSAKSWLCHGGVDRTAAILPWGAGEDVQKISPVEASARYLQHLREAWNEHIAQGREDHLFEQQFIILTVPASFDEVARELTVTAAEEAGLSRVVLVEEPLAAFYAWLSQNEQDWNRSMRPGQLIWVCDVGGGTTDFTIVAIREGQKGLRFDRLAVGDHLMLGGDNMDLTLGRHLEMQLLGKPGGLESNRWRELCHQCRQAKETLLGDSGDDSQAEITVLGSGGKLIADTLRGTLTGEDIERLILDGFFPTVPMADIPEGVSRTGLTEWGLPYVQDPAITQHLAAFWQRFQPLLCQETGREKPYPDFVLFNGGALAPGSIRHRLLEVIKDWFEPVAGPSWAPQELNNPSPELAVAIGAAYYGLVRQGQGVRVGAGSPRAFYVEVEPENKKAVSGLRKAVCLVPRGTEEGFEIELDQLAFEVLANQPASFQLFCSSTRLGDQLGEVADLAEDEITVFPQIRTVLRHGKKGAARSLPIKLGVKLTEVGTLELWCHSLQSPHRWQLRFDVRQQTGPSVVPDIPGETLDAESTDRALARIEATFQTGNASKEDAPEGLLKALSAAVKMKKEKWSTPLIRRFADTLLENSTGRALSPQHEARWLNLLGFCLRPGFGDPVDEWRMKEVWTMFLQGLRFPKQVPSRTELWIFLRRVAGGLSAGQQWRVYQQLSPYLLSPGGKKKKAEGNLPKRLNTQEEIEVWMSLANLERLPVEAKTELGRILLRKLEKKVRPQELWALSRFGARIPLYGPLDRVIPSKEAASWLKKLLGFNLPVREAAAHALVHIARFTGDRARDISDKDRNRAAKWLDPMPQAERFRELLTSPQGTWQKEEQDWAFGESLPTGLVLFSSAQDES